MNEQIMNDILQRLDRMADALEKQSPSREKTAPDWDQYNLWIWQSSTMSLKPITDTNILPLSLLVRLETQKDVLYQNTEQFAQGYAANNALLWGARGTGKSALTKSIFQELRETYHSLNIVEIYREDLNALIPLLDILREAKDQRFILFCDDLSFDENDSSYKSLKALLDGGVQSRPSNVILYATSNRRHLLPRNMIENERSTAIHKSESVEEKVSLSDRFGLWLGFYNADQNAYLDMIHGYARYYDLKIDDKDALEWAITRGNRSGRVAWQFIQHIAGQQKKLL
ncbi:MAG: ATP-binding protein [Pseudomonadota bacterium]